ncbi:hypothetical protein DL768_000292 [Monosporascus sp. mg162]|nr:hypothetical protein DL768_000292 [Monosporascus sp. mg162]
MEERELADKIAYFKRLSTIQAEENGDDAYDNEEKAHRERCKTFYNATSTSSRAKSRTPSDTGLQKADTASQPLPRPDGSQGSDDLEIIRVTPRNPSSRLGAVGIADKTPDVDEEIVPETAHPDPKPAHSSLHPLLRPRMTRQTSGLTLDNSPSTSTAKRKKQARLKLLPENQQIFRGLRFYYIPNDDANGVRAAQITKARERGATLVRTLKEATHVIVDVGLTYQDIKSDLMSDSRSAEKVIVNANYPIDCGIHRVILDPNQEKYVRNLRVADTPPAPSPLSLPASAQASNNSLEIKGKQHKRPRKDQESPPGTQSDYGEPLQSNTQSMAPMATIAAASADDELSQYISLVQGNSLYLEMPLGEEEEDSAHSEATKDDDAESGSESSENESSRKKKRKTVDKIQLDQEDTTWQNSFACMKGGTREGIVDNPNAATIELFQSMVDMYEHQDAWRCKSYRRAITALRQQSRKITTAKEAMKLPDIGKSLAAKIEEIAADGRLRKLEHAQQRPENKILNLFLKVYGVGISQANKWVSQGYRTLEDLQKKANLSTNQRIGIEHFEDLNERIPRWEVEALAAVIREAAGSIDASVEFIIGGSYRRGSDSSGDIDLIITKKGTSSSQDLRPFLEKLIKRLADDGFLTAALASFSENTNKGHGSKWHGCCVLPETAFPKDKGRYRPIWRRIDLLLVPETEFGAALIYFTGNDIFNRSIRLLASKKGLRLNQRGLFKGVPRGRGGVTYTDGDLLEGRDEKRIFELLGVKWREPHERWC